ncbi:DUF2391 family protein [Candidatus Woesearchaeota archaeon]|nr:DUF2391 family protein [Candidatus Woesearchaeota archaeon]
MAKKKIRKSAKSSFKDRTKGNPKKTPAKQRNKGSPAKRKSTRKSNKNIKKTARAAKPGKKTAGKSSTKKKSPKKPAVRKKQTSTTKQTTKKQKKVDKPNDLEISNLKGELIQLKHEDEEINQKLDIILDEQSKLFNMDKELRKSEKKIIGLEEQELAEEVKISKDEINEEEELKKIESLEQQIKERVGPHPLIRITYKDITKGAIGAFVGIVGHFAFLEGVHVAENLTMLRATLLYIIALLIGLGFLYFSGFRKVKQVRIMHFVPIRLLVIYFTAVAIIALVFYIFGLFGWHTTFTEAYKSISAVMILAIIGAATADLIGDRE